MVLEAHILESMQNIFKYKALDFILILHCKYFLEFSLVEAAKPAIMDQKNSFIFSRLQLLYYRYKVQCVAPQRQLKNMYKFRDFFFELISLLV